MRAKEYLNEIAKIDKMIKNKAAEIEHWKAVAESTTVYSEGEHVQSTSTGQKLANAVVKYVTIQEELEEDVNRLIAVRREVIHTIEQLDSEKYDILHKRYVQCKSFKEIAIEINNTVSWVTTKHGRALQDVQRILEKKSMNCDKSE